MFFVKDFVEVEMEKPDSKSKGQKKVDEIIEISKETELIDIASQPLPSFIQLPIEPAKILTEIDLEFANEYGRNLIQETERLIRDQRETDRLSHSIEAHVIEDAKVGLNLILNLI